MVRPQRRNDALQSRRFHNPIESKTLNHPVGPLVLLKLRNVVAAVLVHEVVDVVERHETVVAPGVAGHDDFAVGQGVIEDIGDEA